MFVLFLSVHGLDLLYHILVSVLSKVYVEIAREEAEWGSEAFITGLQIDRALGNLFALILIIVCFLMLCFIALVLAEQIVNIMKKTTTYQRKAFQTRDNAMQSDTSSMLQLDDSVNWRNSNLVKQSLLPEKIRISRRLRRFCCFTIDNETEMRELEEETKDISS